MDLAAVLLRAAQAVGAVAGLEHAIAVVDQDAPQQRAHRILVLHHQDGLATACLGRVHGVTFERRSVVARGKIDAEGAARAGPRLDVDAAA